MACTHPAPKAQPFCGLPSFIRGLCMTAATGGGNSYRDVGWSLARSLPSMQSYAYETDAEFQARLDYLGELVRAGDRPAVLHWFVDEYPRCMQLVPHRRRQAFVDGVFAAVESGDAELRL